MKEQPTILTIDDDPEAREFVSCVLGEAYRVRGAACGLHGLYLARHLGPAAIVLDVIMPSGMDGFRVLCELRKDPHTRDIPVIILSSVNRVTDSAFDAGLLEQYLGAAPSAFLEKPIEPRVLLAEVARVLAQTG